MQRPIRTSVRFLYDPACTFPRERRGKTDRVVNSLVSRIYDLVSAGDFRFVRHETEGTPSADDLVFYYTSEWFEFVVNESYELCQAGIWSRSALSKTENGSQSFQNGTSAIMQWN